METSIDFFFTCEFYKSMFRTQVFKKFLKFKFFIYYCEIKTDNSKNMDNFPEIWYRYVDDIFAIVDKEFTNSFYDYRKVAIISVVEFQYRWSTIVFSVACHTTCKVYNDNVF